MSAAIGQIIGTGIMSLTGIAIAMTGRSVPISFVLSTLFVLAYSLPMARSIQSEDSMVGNIQS